MAEPFQVYLVRHESGFHDGRQHEKGVAGNFGNPWDNENAFKVDQIHSTADTW